MFLRKVLAVVTFAALATGCWGWREGGRRHDGAARLAQIYLRAGDSNKAESIWTRLAGGKQEPHKVLQTVDSLLAHNKPQTALEIAERLHSSNPDQWEALYREGEALVALEKPEEAERRFRTLLAMAKRDDEPSAESKVFLTAKPGRPRASRR